MSSIKLLPWHSRTATTSPPSHLPINLRSTGSSLSHYRRLHHRSSCMSRLAAVALHWCSAEPSWLTATAVGMMHMLGAARHKRNDGPLGDSAGTRTCRSGDISIFFPDNSLYLWLTLSCKQHSYVNLNETKTIYDKSYSRVPQKYRIITTWLFKDISLYFWLMT